MSEHSKLKSRYRGGWENVQDECPLCEMDEKTEWHFETADWVIAEKLNGIGDFIVYKTHKSYLSDDEWAEMERMVSLCYDDYEIRVLMDHVEDHWHGHVIEEEQ
jgi:hypothetical protein